MTQFDAKKHSDKTELQMDYCFTEFKTSSVLLKFKEFGGLALGIKKEKHEKNLKVTTSDSMMWVL